MPTLHGVRLWDEDRTIDLRIPDADGPCLHDEDALTDGDIDAEGYILAPGLADPHVHFRDPGQTHKESMISGARAAASGGYTQVLVMPNTLPALDGAPARRGETGADEVLDAGARDAIDYLQHYETIHGLDLPVHYDLSVCASADRAGERPSDPRDWSRYLVGGEAEHQGSRHPVTAMSDDGSAVSDTVLDAALAHVRGAHLRLLEHCEHHEAGVMNEGSVNRRLGLPGIPASTELTIVERDIDAARRTGTPIHFQHVSTAKAFDAVRGAKREGLPITCETAPHYLALCDEDVARYGTLAKMNPPLRSRGDREATLRAIADGTVDMIATDHAPHTTLEKQGTFLEAPNGIIGLETAYAVCHSVLVDGGIIDERRLIELMAVAPTLFMGHAPTDVHALAAQAHGPSRVVDLGGLSDLSVDARNPQGANLVVLCPGQRWTIDPERFHSMARNTPFGGWHVSGLPVATIMDSRLVFSRIPRTRRQGA